MKLGRIMALTVVLVLLGAWAYCADCANGGRYEDMGDGTVQDCRTGLVWLKDADCTDYLGIPRFWERSDVLNWHDAMDWTGFLHSGHCGLTDGSQEGFWRLPTITELMAMVAYGKKMGYNPTITNAAGTDRWTTNGNAFNNVQVGAYWSSSGSFNSRWTVIVYNGFVQDFLDSESLYVWPVRAGQVGGNDASFGSLTLQ